MTDSENRLMKSMEKSIDASNWGGMHHLTIDELNQLLAKQMKVKSGKKNIDSYKTAALKKTKLLNQS